MQHLETFLPIAEADRISCRHLLMFLTVFSGGCKKRNTAVIKISLLFMTGLFIGFLVQKCFACQIHRKFRMLSFSLFTLLDAKEGSKAQAILASLEGFLGAAS